MNILEVEDLVKNYGTFEAVKGISFVVPKGKVIGFLGPNGAGKSTTIQILLGITLPTKGSIRYFGRDFTKERMYCLQRINYTSAFNTLQYRITVMENLMVFAYLYGLKNPKKKISELLSYFEIETLSNVPYKDLSTGQKTRVNLVKALLNDPEILLMDEPTASLDPDIADKTITLIERLKKERNLSILYTSHDMEEVTRVCDEVIFLNHGKIVAHDTPLGLTKRIQFAELRLMFDGNKKLVDTYLKKEKLKYSFSEKQRVVIETTEEKIPKIILGLSKEDISITDIEVKKPTLEDVFLNLSRKKII